MYTLNLYENIANAATSFPQTSIYNDATLPAFPELDLETTYEKVHISILKRAYQLHQLGIKKGDHVIIFQSPTIGTYFLACAVSYLGAVPVMVSYHFSSHVLDVFTDRLEDPFILYDEQTKACVFQMHQKHERHFSMKEVLKQTPIPTPQQKLEAHLISYMTHTSGTTGIPKLICHSAYSMGWRVLWQETILKKMAEKKVLAFHISPVHSRFNIGVASAMKLNFPLFSIQENNAEKVADLLEKRQAYALETHPNNFVQWRTAAERFPEKFSSLHYYHSTFDAINMATMKTFLLASKKNHPIFLQVYGQSECGPMILKTHDLNSIHTDNGRNMGKGLGELTKARITDDKGRLLPIGQDGHIQLYSKGRALTYYKEEERFLNNVYGPYWDSGDWGCIDEKGNLYLKDRQVDLIQKMDSTLALEDTLLDQLQFLEEVVIVRDSERRPQPILALKEGQQMNWSLWWESVNDLPFLKAPLIWRWDDFPRTATMKVQRLKIEQQLKEQ